MLLFCGKNADCYDNHAKWQFYDGWRQITSGDKEVTRLKADFQPG
ncbi:hypothetical protein HMPREF0758_0147 [Serratia odorifera DSM 4582]|uniref:Uncharacterized protein n=1 Tax=Serratia odorifera DSM 4582 TaxID=667129 RepID=D4DW47_SEROD|nr:hypothetical protein HMPREF0758_0147 [Serratia odorifera DSM 4582]